MKGINSLDENGYWSCYSNDKWSVRKIYDDVIGYECTLSGERFDALEIVDKLASLEAENAKLKALVERLVDAGQVVADLLPYSGENETPVDEFDVICDEWQSMKVGEE